MENISLILLKRLFFRVVCCFYQETLKAGQRKKVFGGGVSMFTGYRERVTMKREILKTQER